MNGASASTISDGELVANLAELLRQERRLTAAVAEQIALLAPGQQCAARAWARG